MATLKTNLIEPEGATTTLTVGEAGGNLVIGADSIKANTLKEDALINTETFLATDTWACPTGVTSIEYLIVAGGGGGGGEHGGGGGAGEFKTSTATVVAGTTYTMTVGAGGVAVSGNNDGNDGAVSTITGSGFATISSAGGGGGGSTTNDGRAGGSGGGGSRGGTGGASTAAAGGFGNAGGASHDNSGPDYGGGGGGGSGGIGGAGISTAAGLAGIGKLGFDGYYYGGGGGASAHTGPANGSAGGIGGGGGGASDPGGSDGAGGQGGRNGGSAASGLAGGAAGANTGGGGGAGSGNGGSSGGAGGSGAVVIKYAGDSSTVFTSNGSGTVSSVSSEWGGVQTLLSSQTASDSASISFTSGIDSTYDEYVWEFINMNPATNTVDFTFQVNAVGASGFDETMTTTYFQAGHDEADGSPFLQYQTGRDQAQGTAYQILANHQGSGSDESLVGELHLFNPASTTYVKNFYSTMQEHYNDGSDSYSENNFIAGYVNITAAIDEISFKMSSGNMDGVIKMYGIK